MGTLANSLFQILLGWTRTLSAEIWNTFSSPDGTTLLSWLGEHWKGLALLMCAAGLAVDLIVYLFRWQPYRVWRSRHCGSSHYVDETGDTEEMPSGPGPEGTSEPIRHIKNGNQWENRMESIPEKMDLRTNTGNRWNDAGEDFREETDLTGDEQDPPYPEAEEIPVQEENEDPWKVYRRPAERYIRNAYDADSEEEQLSAWRQPEERDLPPEEEERVTEKFEQAIRPRRRRSVRAMLNDRQETEVPAPEQLIDRNEAYRRPVYPRSWLESEETR